MSEDCTILVVCREGPEREALCDLLSAGGADVHLAGSLGEAVRIAGAVQPDVMVLDAALDEAEGAGAGGSRLDGVARLVICDGADASDAADATRPRPRPLAQRERGEEEEPPTGRLVRPFEDDELLAQVGLLWRLGQAERRVARRGERLDALRRHAQEFADVVSHDLKEPLRTIASYCQLLSQRYAGRLDAEADEFIGHVTHGVNRMRQFLDDLLAYSRVGRVEEAFEPVDLRAAVDQAVANLRQAIDESGATIRIGPLPTIQANGRMMVQLMQNLLGNAVRFRGLAAPIVRVSAVADEQGCRVTVEDNGIGIEARYFERIFGVFQRLHGPDAYPGTGMGLAICKRIVDHHAGRIWLESTPRQGSRFHVELPAGMRG